MCFMDVPDSLHGLQFHLRTRAVEVPSMSVYSINFSKSPGHLNSKSFMIASLACVRDQTCLLLALRMVVMPQQDIVLLCKQLQFQWQQHQRENEILNSTVTFLLLQ